MSVAFRREGDDEHLEPKFEIPIPPGPNLVTPRGLALINARVAEVVAEVARLTADGADQARIDAARRDLRYWQTRQITAELVAVPSGETVEIGTRVTFRHNGRERELIITGDDEADPGAGRIAFSAPLARALLGAEPGELLEFAGKPDALEVLAIAVVPADTSA
ncbi:MAG: GreA/GreB family elongation factor [Sphingomonadales bacterium]|nr:GreA/GreB family elongation factor [Sphingomonadales bacterium]